MESDETSAVKDDKNADVDKAKNSSIKADLGKSKKSPRLQEVQSKESKSSLEGNENLSEDSELNTESVSDVIDAGKSPDNTSDVMESEKSPDNTSDVVESEKSETIPDAAPEVKIPRRRGRKRKIYNEDDDPDTIKEKRKKRALELKLRSLQCSLTETTEVSGKRQKRAPQRFELQPTEKRKSTVVDGKGKGEFLGDIRWINHQLRAASLYTLRLLHRIIYRKQGMFAEKHIIKSVMKFNGYPFDANHPEVKRRQELLEKMPTNALQQLCYLLGLRPGTNAEMMDRIINFLLCPSQKEIEAYITEVMDNKLQNSRQVPIKQFESPVQKTDASAAAVAAFCSSANNYKQEESDGSCLPQFSTPVIKVDLTSPWKKPPFFLEGNGVKLKFIRAVIANIESASDAFIELMHRLLFLDVDEKVKMRRNILEFSGLKCEVGTPNYVYRVRILSVLPMEQLKLICRVLCLPTWHRSRQYLTDAIMDFLSVPRIACMKKKVPPVFSEDISFSFENTKVNQVKIPELKSVESEEIEIIPDIHLPDETSSHLGSDLHMENEYLGVKLKNFSNIHYQVISTPAAKLNEVHMILYLTPSAQNNIRKNILEFSGFPFDENSAEYQSRRTLMEQMNVESLKTVATVLCVFQYICGDSKKSLIDAILKFLLKPSALLSSSTIMPTITPSPTSKVVISPPPPVIRTKATSTTLSSKTSKPLIIKPNFVVSDAVKAKSDSKDSSVKLIIDAISSSGKNEPKTELEIEKVKACLSKTSIEITPVPLPKNEKELPTTKTTEPSKSALRNESVHNQPAVKNEAKSPNVSEAETLSDVKKEVSSVAPRVQYFSSDDDDDQPLSKMIGHPNDDQLKALVSKIIKESKLEEITMKHVIRKVFETYPNYDLNYRKEFIKSNVRLILSQMDDQNCSVSTTVINI